MKLENERTYICDVSECAILKLSGKSVLYFLKVMCSASFPSNLKEKLKQCFVCSQGLFLNAQSQVIEIPFILFTSLTEVLLFCHPENADELEMWLEAHSEIKDDKGVVFEDVDIENVSDSLATLIVIGKGAKKHLKDLNDACVKGKFYIDASLKDCNYGVLKLDSYIVCTANKLASQIGDFFAQFKDIEALDYEEYKELLIKDGLYRNDLYEPEYVCANSDFYKRLMRSDRDFVGAKNID